MLWKRVFKNSMNSLRSGLFSLAHNLLDYRNRDTELYIGCGYYLALYTREHKLDVVSTICSVLTDIDSKSRHWRFEVHPLLSKGFSEPTPF